MDRFEHCHHGDAAEIAADEPNGSFLPLSQRLCRFCQPLWPGSPDDIPTSKILSGRSPRQPGDTILLKHNILDVMKDTGPYGIRITGFPGLQRYGVTSAITEQSLKRSPQVVTISWNGRLADPDARQATLDSARTAMKFLADFGANHLVVFPAQPPRRGGHARRLQGTLRALQSDQRDCRPLSSRLALQSYGPDGPDSGRAGPVYGHDRSKTLWSLSRHLPFECFGVAT